MHLVEGEPLLNERNSYPERSEDEWSGGYNGNITDKVL
jgi:hypothetical protein